MLSEATVCISEPLSDSYHLNKLSATVKIVSHFFFKGGEYEGKLLLNLKMI